jgi:hypothetical protein
MLWRILAFWVLFTTNSHADSDLCSLASKRESKDIRAFLVTLSPGEKVWSSFGHSAIWISNGKTGKDLIYNFGTFDGRQPNLLGRYLNGTLEYWLSVNSYKKDFRRYNKTEDRIFVASRLLLPKPKIQELYDELTRLKKPENRSYIYHWSENSCATKIRDLLNDLSDNQIFEQNQELTLHTYRSESLRHLSQQPLVWFGWHYIANDMTDQPLNEWDLMYSPVRFRERLKDTDLKFPNGKTVPLVPYECSYDAGLEWAPEKPPDYSRQLVSAGLLGGLISVIFGYLSKRSRVARIVLSLIILAVSVIASLLGTIHAALYFSALEGLHPNLNQLLASPIHWLLVAASIQTFRSKWHKAYINSLIISGMAFLCILIVLSGLRTQNNTELLLMMSPIYFGFTGGLWLARRQGSPNCP